MLIKKLKDILCYEFLKRLFDIIFVFLVIIPIAPVFIVIYILIFFFDNGPVIFKQIRVGKNGIFFTIYKFRTMKFINNPQFDGLLNDISEGNKEYSRKNFKTTEINDSRITKIGRLIRPIHLDELPQLFNVLKGDMSLVGPRPDVPVQKLDYRENFWNMRISVMPGITGLAQLYPCEKLSQRNNLDRLYVKKRSFLFDFNILIKTVFKLFYFKSN
tara:strand:+ start:342 stop:986 length:645 start_codon:yes stop_codon:yes gene_type:complete